jgi:Ca2+-binding EF-hand superfamily protein
MKTNFYVVGLAALFAGTAFAGDAAHGAMRADKDGDGRVSRAEATNAGTERSGEWFDKVDVNKDGYVTPEEASQARESRRETMRSGMKERMEERFKEADINGDGQLSLDEVQAKMPRMAERFTTIDADKNGMLSKDELQRSRPDRHQPPS